MQSSSEGIREPRGISGKTDKEKSPYKNDEESKSNSNSRAQEVSMKPQGRVQKSQMLIAA